MSQSRPPINVQHPDKLYIGGAWVKPSTDRMLEVVSPATEETVFRVAEAGIADVDLAVAAARKAFDEGDWPRMSVAERSAKLRELAAAVGQRTGEIAHAWTEQMGMVYEHGKLWLQPDAGWHFEQFANHAETFTWEERKVPTDQQGVAMVVREPMGVVAVVWPWNGPYLSMALKSAPALVAGCSVILKPPPEAPIDAFTLAECAEEVGMPPGVINICPADRDASDHLVSHPGVDKVSFTGSTLTGRRIASVTGERIARVSLELGGKSAAVILDDADIEHAAISLASSICSLSGQICSTLSRVVVPRASHDKFVEIATGVMQAVKVGDPYDPETQMGPVAMKRQYEKILGYIAKGVEEGAVLATGGKRPDHLDHGYYIEPTLFANADNNMTIAQEEIFGPVITLIPHDGEDDAVRIANDTIYGLNNAVYSSDIERAYRVARRLRSGGVCINQMKVDLGLPFGGFKQSGVGREGGPDNIGEYVELKTIQLPEAIPGI